MTIRRFADADRDQVIHLLRLNTPPYFSPNEEKDLIYYFDNHAENYYVIESESKILGCGGFNLDDDETLAKLSWDIVHPNSHGQGIGTQLTKFRIAKIKDIETVEIISVRTSQLVYKFYEKFGLRLREVVKDYWDEGFDLYRLDNNIQSVG